jgi:hypothetical protein
VLLNSHSSKPDMCSISKQLSFSLNNVAVALQKLIVLSNVLSLVYICRQRATYGFSVHRKSHVTKSDEGIRSGENSYHDIKKSFGRLGEIILKRLLREYIVMICTEVK